VFGAGLAQDIAKTVVTASSVAELMDCLHSSSLSSIPQTNGLEREINESFTDVLLLDKHRIKIPVSLVVGTTHLRITTNEPQVIFPSMQCRLTEIIYFSDIDDIYNVASGIEGNEFVIRRSRGSGTVYFASIARESVVKSVRAARGRLRADGSQSSLNRQMQFGDISAMLLAGGLLNVCHEDENLRSSAYDLLSAVSTYLRYKDPAVLPVKGAFLPGGTAAFASIFSERLAKFAPQLTLDFLSEFAIGFEKSTPVQKAVCIHYVSPWLQNLSSFQIPTSAHYEHSGAKLRSAVRAMIDISVNEPELNPVVQRLIWTEIGKLDNKVLTIVIDELFRAAVDGGLGSRRCELVSEVLAVLTSVYIRGKILTKLRRVIGKTQIKPSRTLSEDPAWNEVAALTRMALVSLYNTRAPIQTQLYAPEIVHLIPLLAFTGPLLMKLSVHAILTNFIQSLSIARADDPEASEKLHQLMTQACTDDTLQIFGLVRCENGQQYTTLETGTEMITVDALEKITRFLLDVIETGAPSTGLGNAWRARWMSLVIATAFQLSPYIQSRAFVVLGCLASFEVDDDLLYQILIAFKGALAAASESDTATVVSMLRCMYRIVPGLPQESRYLFQVPWLAIALIQSSYFSLFADAARLLQGSLETLHNQAAFRLRTMASTLMTARNSLDEISLQLDQMLGLTFDTSFSLSLASTLFKGVRHPPTHPAAVDALRTLLRISAESPRRAADPLDFNKPIQSESLGYFLALLPLTKSMASYRSLLRDAGAGQTWWPDPLPEAEDSLEVAIKVPFEVLGISDKSTALLAASFAVSMLNSSHLEMEKVVLLNLIASMSQHYPDEIALAYEGLYDKINEHFSGSNNAELLEAAGAVFRVAMSHPIWSGGAGGEHSNSMTGKNQLMALEEVGMHGLINNHQFLPSSRAIQLIKWIPELVSKIVEDSEVA
jgi:neurofibromin 1